MEKRKGNCKNLKWEIRVSTVCPTCKPREDPCLVQPWVTCHMMTTSLMMMMGVAVLQPLPSVLQNQIAVVFHGHAQKGQTKMRRMKEVALLAPFPNVLRNQLAVVFH